MNEFVWKPFKNYIITLPINVLAVALSAFILSLAFTGDTPLNADGIKNLIFFALFGVFNVVMGIFMARKHSESIVFTADGITVPNKKHPLTKEWQDLQYAYIAHNFKGHKFLILSDVPLAKSDIKSLLRKNDMTFGKVIIDDILIFPVEEGALHSIRKMMGGKIKIETI